MDAETGQRYTVKQYESTKAKAGDSWQHTEIKLMPANADFAPIILTAEHEEQVRVVAEFVEVLATIA